jgi:hypothetical protein
MVAVLVHLLGDAINSMCTVLQPTRL